MQENFHHMALSTPTLLDEDLLYLALSGGTTNTERWSKFTSWTNAMKGHNLDSFHDSYSNSIFYDDVPSKHVYFDFPCAPLCYSVHTYNPLQEGHCYVVGTFGMHKEYWEKEKYMMKLEGTSRVQRDDLALIKAEENLKESLACDASKEEIDYFNGKLSKEALTRLVVRLRMLQRNIELKGKALERDMCEPSLLGVLKRRIQKFLLKLQAYGRARKPKEKKATRKKSGKKHKTKAQIFQEAKLEARANASHDDFEAYVPNHKVGRDHLHKGHNNKFFKENFKPP